MFVTLVFCAAILACLVVPLYRCLLRNNTPKEVDTLSDRLMMAGDQNNLEQVASIWSEITSEWSGLPESCRVDCMRAMYLKVCGMHPSAMCEMGCYQFLSFFYDLYDSHREVRANAIDFYVSGLLQFYNDRDVLRSMIICCGRTACGVGLHDK
jgi:hypothetical protein